MILKRGRAVIKKRFDQKKLAAKNDVPKTKTVTKNHSSKTRSTVNERVSKKEENGLWVDSIEHSVVDSAIILVDSTNTNLINDEKIDISDSHDLEGVSFDKDLCINGIQESPQIINSIPKIRNYQDSCNFEKTGISPCSESFYDNTMQPSKELKMPKILDAVTKVCNGQTSSKNKAIIKNSKNNIQDDEDCKMKNVDFAESGIIHQLESQKQLSDKTTSIQDTENEVYSINNRFFEPNNYDFANSKSSKDDLLVKVEPEITKSLRESLKAKNNSSHITEADNKTIDNSSSILHNSSRSKTIGGKFFSSEECIDCVDSSEVELRKKPLPSERCLKDSVISSSKEDINLSEVELRNPLRKESNFRCTEKIKRPLTEDLQLSRSVFLRNSIHEMQHTNFAFKRYFNKLNVGFSSCLMIFMLKSCVILIKNITLILVRLTFALTLCLCITNLKIYFVD